ncbi:MAG TPA: hypothetical protein VIG24_00490 [Acidimicrobiia bacterium]
MTTATATITRFSEEIQVKHEDGRADLYRYRCSFCGGTGRWIKDGATVNYYLRRHQGDSMERTPCPKIR